MSQKGRRALLLWSRLGEERQGRRKADAWYATRARQTASVAETAADARQPMAGWQSRRRRRVRGVRYARLIHARAREGSEA